MPVIGCEQVVKTPNSTSNCTNTFTRTSYFCPSFKTQGCNPQCNDGVKLKTTKFSFCTTDEPYAPRKSQQG